MKMTIARFVFLAELFYASFSFAQSITEKCLLDDSDQLPYKQNSLVPADDGGIVVLENFKQKKENNLVITKYSKSLQKEWSQTACAINDFEMFYCFLISHKDRIKFFNTSYDKKTKTSALTLYEYDLKGNLLRTDQVQKSANYAASYVVSPDRTKLLVIPCIADEVWLGDPEGTFFIKNATGSANPKMIYFLYDLVNDKVKEGSVTLTGLTSSVLSDIALSNSGMLMFYGFNGKNLYMVRVDIISQTLKNKIESAAFYHHPLALSGEKVLSFEDFDKEVLNNKGNVKDAELGGMKWFTYDFEAGKEIVGRYDLDETLKAALLETYDGHQIKEKAFLDGFIERMPVAAANGFYLCLERVANVTDQNASTVMRIVEYLNMEMIVAYVDLNGKLQWTKVLDKESSGTNGTPQSIRIPQGNDLYVIYENNFSMKTRSPFSKKFYAKPNLICEKADASGTMTRKNLFPDDYEKWSSYFYSTKTTSIGNGAAILVVNGVESKKGEFHKVEF